MLRVALVGSRAVDDSWRGLSMARLEKREQKRRRDGHDSTLEAFRDREQGRSALLSSRSKYPSL